MNQRLIVINGKTYKSVDEMPPDVRAQYEAAMRNFDKNQNGVPDLLEMNPFADKNKDGVPDIIEDIGGFQGSIGNVTRSTKIIVNGQEYDSVDQLPPDVRAKYQRMMGKLDANGNGIPDFAEGMMTFSTQTTNAAPIRAETQTPLRSNPKPAPVSIEPESTSGWMLALAGIIFIGACLALAAAGVWYYF